MADATRPKYSHPLVTERAVDERRPLKVTYVGAGMSGLIAGILLPRYVPDLDLTIYEKNEDVGGTWFENKYPGCACDIPSHSYQLSFEPNVEWSKFYSRAAEIQQYWHRVADKYNLRRLIKFRHRIIEARWNGETAKWHTQIEDMNTGRVFEEVSDVLCSAQGILNDWQWPKTKGLNDFEGKLLHSATWDTSYDVKDRNVAIIGSGSSGIQIVAAIQKQVKHMDHYAHNPTWVSPNYGQEFARPRSDGQDENFTYTSAEIATWKSDPEEYLKYRKSIELAMQSGYAMTHRDSPELHGMTQFFEQNMRDRLKERPELASGYLEALTTSNVDVISTRISHVDSTGIVTTDGTRRNVEAIICATGFNTTFLNRLPVFGTSLTDRYKARPESYLAITLDDFPNFFQASGPNCGHVAGSFPVLLERVHMYMGQLLSRLSQSNVRSKVSVVQGFTDHYEAFFERTMFSARCSS